MSRPETGTMRFEGDWMGVFIRGDNALMHYAPALRRILARLPAPDGFTDRLDVLAIEGLIERLSGCADDGAVTPVNDLRAFEACAKEDR